MKTINSNFFKLYSKANRKLKILFDNPFLEGNKKLIVHCCHHKVGTVWFKNVFRRVADRYGLIFQDCKQDELHSYTDIFLQDHSHINLFTLPDHRGLI